MTERIRKIYERLKKKEYRKLRNTDEFLLSDSVYDEKDLALRSAFRLAEAAKAERAVLFAEDRIGMMRTIGKIPKLLRKEEAENLYRGKFVFDGGQVCNISSDYAEILSDGFLKKRKQIRGQLPRYERGSKEYNELAAMDICIDAVETIAEKLVKVVDTIETEPELVAKYEERYQQFRKLYPAVKGLF